MTSDRQRLTMFAGMGMTLFPAIVVNLVASRFAAAFQASSAQLPAITRALVAGRHGLWLLPVLVYAIWKWAQRGGYRAQSGSIALLAAMALTGATIVFAVFALYLPIIGFDEAAGE